MRRTLAVTLRELSETRNVWAAAFVASLVAILSPLLPGFRREAADDVRTAMALYLAGSFFVGLVLVLGASLVGRELKDRRMGFYFSKPLSAFAIWAGKFLGASLVAFGSALLVLLPTAVLAWPNFLRLERLSPLVLVASAALAFASIHAVHSVSLAVRSRSQLLLLDLALLGVAALTSTAVARSLVREHAVGALRRGSCVFALIASAAFVAASFASVAGGRTDIRAAHRALSTTLWVILLPATLLFALYQHWVLAAAPKDLREVEEMTAAPSGSWVALSGRTRGRADYRPTFLLNTATGRFRKLGESEIVESAVFSRNGRLALWLERDSAGRSFDLRAARLDGGSPISFQTKLSFASRWTPIALSTNGERIAVVERHRASHPLLSVYDLASGRLLGSASVADARYFFFVTPDRVRIYTFLSAGPGVAEGRVDISELDLPAKKVETTGTIDPLPDRFILRAEPSGRLVLVQDFGKGIPEIRLHDARTGRVLAVLSSEEAISTRWADFLSDGRIAVAEAGPVEARVRIHSPEGDEQTSVPLGPGGSVALGGELAGGRIIVVVRPARPASATRNAVVLTSKIFVVDTATGEGRQVATGLFPVSTRWSFVTDPSLTYSPGSDAATLFFDPGFSLVRLDPKTGEQRKILAGKDRS